MHCTTLRVLWIQNIFTLTKKLYKLSRGFNPAVMQFWTPFLPTRGTNLKAKLNTNLVGASILTLYACPLSVADLYTQTNNKIKIQAGQRAKLGAVSLATLHCTARVVVSLWSTASWYVYLIIKLLGIGSYLPASTAAL